MSTHRFATQLILGFCSIILLSTLGVGVPVYWLIQRELNRQAWANVYNATQSSQSLLQAETERVRNLAVLLSERPTLHRILRQDATTELIPYLAAFQAQSQLDILHFCTQIDRDIPGDLPGNVTASDCPVPSATGFTVWQNQPVLLVSQPVAEEEGTQVVGVVVAGIWLDADFLQQMRRSTGMEQSLLTTNLVRLTSSLADLDNATVEAVVTTPLTDDPTRHLLTVIDRRFYAITAPLPTAGDGAPLCLEVALPIDEMIATERRALALLLVSTSLIAVTGLLLATWYVRRLTRPLWQLTQVAERISHGDYVAAIPAIAQPVEIATLSTALIKSQATMLRALNERSDFLASMSHDFQTPLSTLNAAMELIMNEPEDLSDALSATEMRQLLQPAHMSLVGLQNLISNLLQSSAIEAGHFALRQQPVDLAAIVTDAQQIIQPLLNRRQQRLALPDRPVWPTVIGDAARLTQVLVNLLVNASKYSPIHSQIDLTVQREGNVVQIRVADRGTGIPTGDRSNLFRRFVRLVTQDGEQYGIGLGLYVVKTTIERHGGRVGVEDRPGGGSIFWFTIPLTDQQSINVNKLGFTQDERR